MKNNTLTQKLSLKKKTIANLENKAMEMAKGGVRRTIFNCPTWNALCITNGNSDPCC